MTTTFTPAFDINPTGTTAALGRNLRLRRLFGADGRTVTVALDQAVPRGVAPRLATIGTTFTSIAEGEPDAVTITKGLAGPLLGGDRAPLPWILKASMFSGKFTRLTTPPSPPCRTRSGWVPTPSRSESPPVRPTRWPCSRCSPV